MSVFGDHETQQSSDGDYSEKEAQQRFDKLVQLALKTPPKPIKSMTRKGVPAQSKKRRKQAKGAA
jgi:hypothetical protein